MLIKISSIIYCLLILIILIVFRRVFIKDILLSFLIILTVSISLFIAIIMVSNGYQIELYNGIDIPLTSAIGTLIGGLLTPIVSLISIYLFIKNLRLQQQEISRQNELTNDYYIEKYNEPKIQMLIKCEKEIDEILKMTIYKKMIHNVASSDGKKITKDVASKRTYEDILMEQKGLKEKYYFKNESMTLFINVLGSMSEISDYLTIMINSLNSIKGKVNEEYIKFYYSKYYSIPFFLFDTERYEYANRYSLDLEKQGKAFQKRMDENRKIIKNFFDISNAPLLNGLSITN